MRDLLTGEEVPGACPLCFMENAQEGNTLCMKCEAVISYEAEKLRNKMLDVIRARRGP